MKTIEVTLTQYAKMLGWKRESVSSALSGKKTPKGFIAKRTEGQRSTVTVDVSFFPEYTPVGTPNTPDNQ